MYVLLQNIKHHNSNNKKNVHMRWYKRIKNLTPNFFVRLPMSLLFSNDMYIILYLVFQLKNCLALLKFNCVVLY